MSLDKKLCFFAVFVDFWHKSWAHIDEAYYLFCKVFPKTLRVVRFLVVHYSD